MSEQMPLTMAMEITSRQVKRFYDSKIKCEIFNEATRNQCRIIGFLQQNEGRDIYQKDIEKEFDIRRSTATNILKLMEKKGLIERHRFQQDERLKRIVLTSSAKDGSAEMDKNLERLNKQIEAGITPEEKKVFLGVLEKIVNNIKEGDSDV